MTLIMAYFKIDQILYHHDIAINNIIDQRNEIRDAIELFLDTFLFSHEWVHNAL
jgi:hypothetical protein